MLLRARRPTAPPAAVVGDLDLVRPLGLAGVRPSVVCPEGHPTRFSRFAAGWIDSAGPDLADRLVAWAQALPERPLLFIQTDAGLRLFVEASERLEAALRFVMPPAELVTDLLDKARFQALAERAELPIPAARWVAAGDPAGAAGLPAPFIVKPASRARAWWDLVGWSKVVRIDAPEEWDRLAPQLAERGIDVLLQEYVPGGEDRVESYHFYADAGGTVRGEFTGRKLRTRPADFGISTALLTTDAPDVRAAGRTAVERLGLRGPAKLDFKRAPDGTLRLFEVNPRFTLWAHLGFRAGVNLPALMVAELTGAPFPPLARARPGVRWMEPRQDVAAVREQGGSLVRWAPWALRCEAKSGAALDDPMPILRGKVWPRLRRGGD